MGGLAVEVTGLTGSGYTPEKPLTRSTERVVLAPEKEPRQAVSAVAGDAGRHDAAALPVLSYWWLRCKQPGQDGQTALWLSWQQPCKPLWPRTGFRQSFFLSLSLQLGRKGCQTLERDIAASAELRFFTQTFPSLRAVHPRVVANFARFLLCFRALDRITSSIQSSC